MKSMNLGIVFGPTLFRPKDGLDYEAKCLLNMGAQNGLIECMIEQYEWLLNLD